MKCSLIALRTLTRRLFQASPYESFNMLDNLVSGRKKTFLRINFYRAYLCSRFFLRYDGITEVTMERNAANGTSGEEKTRNSFTSLHSFEFSTRRWEEGKKKTKRVTSSRQIIWRKNIIATEYPFSIKDMLLSCRGKNGSHNSDRFLNNE